jgi:hypothetical protein
MVREKIRTAKLLVDALASYLHFQLHELQCLIGKDTRLKLGGIHRLRTRCDWAPQLPDRWILPDTVNFLELSHHARCRSRRDSSIASLLASG